jgi:nucleotidyltransferase/DNA polymerase involved in DNA repair
VAGELAAVPLPRLESACGEADAQWLHRLARGIDDEEARLMLPAIVTWLFYMSESILVHTH